MTIQEKINAFEKAKNFYAPPKPKKWWQFLKRKNYSPSPWYGFCFFFSIEGFSYSEREYLAVYYEKYASDVILEDAARFSGYIYNNSSERYEACIKILEELKEEKKSKLEQLKP